MLDTDLIDHLSFIPKAKHQLTHCLGAATTAISLLLMDLELSGKVMRQANEVLAHFRYSYDWFGEINASFRTLICHIPKMLH